jgi:hypothetical protein
LRAIERQAFSNHPRPLRASSSICVWTAQIKVGKRSRRSRVSCVRPKLGRKRPWSRRSVRRCLRSPPRTSVASSSTAATGYRFNHYGKRCNGSLLGRDMRAKMAPSRLARSPKTHSNPTINRLLPRRNRALLLQQQTTGNLGLGMSCIGFCPDNADSSRKLLRKGSNLSHFRV